MSRFVCKTVEILSHDTYLCIQVSDEKKLQDFFMAKKNSGLVYSTQSGKTCPRCEKPIDECVCEANSDKGGGDSVIKIRRETKGRGGKTVTTIFGIIPNQQKKIATRLKQHCGTGGSAKDGIIIIQGDQRQKVKSFLEKNGYTVKLSGG